LHKNLKTKNILIRNGVYKIIDFGLPTVIEGDSYEKSGSNFLIPEVMLKKNYDQKA
jgi:serine/threonine protein kinase